MPPTREYGGCFGTAAIRGPTSGDGLPVPPDADRLEGLAGQPWHRREVHLAPGHARLCRRDADLGGDCRPGACEAHGREGVEGVHRVPAHREPGGAVEEVT